MGSLLDDALVPVIVAWAARRAGVSPAVEALDPGSPVEACLWEGPEGQEALFLLNHSAQPAAARVEGAWSDPASGEAAGPLVPLAPYGVRLLVR